MVPRLPLVRAITWGSDEAFWLSEARRHLQSAINVGEKLVTSATAFHYFFFYRVVAEVGPLSLIVAERRIKPAGPISSFLKTPILLANFWCFGLQTFFGAWSQKEQTAALDEFDRLFADSQKR